MSRWWRIMFRMLWKSADWTEPWWKTNQIPGRLPQELRVWDIQYRNLTGSTSSIREAQPWEQKPLRIREKTNGSFATREAHRLLEYVDYPESSMTSRLVLLLTNGLVETEQLSNSSSFRGQHIPNLEAGRIVCKYCLWNDELELYQAIILTAYHWNYSL